ncbi:MAG: DUF4440 domain-containing protein [Gemmatimonadaceae bacterium]|nr:DUF4440 domain-containing protein [Gemmatimonadaceae bacterium]
MPTRASIRRLANAASAILLLVIASACRYAKVAERPFDPQEIRAAEGAVIKALEAPDPLAWVDHYTDDAVLLEAGSPPVAGRDQLLEMARGMTPLSHVVITASHTEGHGPLAYAYGTASWINGRPPAAGTSTRVRMVMVWRRDASGRWRIAQEVLVPEDAR